MTDREEREKHIKRLEAALACEEKQSSGKCSKAECDDNCALLYEQGNWGEWKETLRYAINSLKTDLKYDLLYEETSGQADKTTPKDDLGVDAISRVKVIDYLCKHCPDDGECFEDCDEIKHLRQMSSVTPQEPILNKIREQIKSHLRGVEITLEVLVENDPLRPKMEGAKDTLEECLEIIDRAESEA